MKPIKEAVGIEQANEALASGEWYILTHYIKRIKGVQTPVFVMLTTNRETSAPVGNAGK